MKTHVKSTLHIPSEFCLLFYALVEFHHKQHCDHAQLNSQGCGEILFPKIALNHDQQTLKKQQQRREKIVHINILLEVHSMEIIAHTNTWKELGKALCVEFLSANETTQKYLCSQLSLHSAFNVLKRAFEALSRYSFCLTYRGHNKIIIKIIEMD